MLVGRREPGGERSKQGRATTSPNCISSEGERDGGRIRSDDDEDSKQKASAFTPMIENRGSDDTKQKVPDGLTSHYPTNA